MVEAEDAVAAVAVIAVAAIGVDRTAGDGDVAAVAGDAAAAGAVFAPAAVGSDRTTAGDGDAAAPDAVAAVFAAAASGVDRTAGNGEAAEAGDAATAGAVFAVAAIGVDRTAGDGEVFAEDAAAAGAVCAAATLGRQPVSFAAGDGEAAAAGDAAAAVTTGEMVVAIQFDRGIAAAGHTHGGFVPAAGVDVHILECDLDLIALIFGLDGHGVLIRRAGDDGVALIFYEVAIALLDFVRPLGLARFHGDVTFLDVPCLGKGRGGKGGEHCGGQDKRCCPLRGRTGRIDTPPPYGEGDPEHAWQAYDKTAYKNLLWMVKKYGLSIDTIIALLGK